jgi:hypothetical protein
MQEATFKDLLEQAMAGQEPPIGRGLLGGAVRAARVARRRRLAARVVAVAAAVPALAFGVPAVVGALAQVTHHHGPSLAGEVPAKKKTSGQATHQATARETGPMFVKPTLPATSPEPNPVPITNQSLGQLLIDDLPAGAHTSQIEAGINPAGSQPGQAPTASETAHAWLNDVTTPIGSGLVQADMTAVGQTPSDFGCAGLDRSSCREYNLPGGILVDEHYMGLLFVDVFRPGVAELTISEADSAMAAGSPTSKGMPLTVSQVLKIALDSRWRWTISQSFVQHASHLRVAALDTAGS